MNWKFWKREEEFEDLEFELASETLPISTLFRWYCYDTGVKNPNRFAEDFGMHPISAEGEDFERQESESRLEGLIPYMPFLNVMSDINAMVLSQTLTNILIEHDLVDESVLEEEQDIMEEIYKSISFSSLAAAFSAGLSLGIIINPGSFITAEADEYEF